MECKYHTIIEQLNEIIWERIDSYYLSPYFYFWLGDQSNLGKRYKETFEEIMEEPLSEEQIALIKKKGDNLETMIHKWCNRWKNNNQNEELPSSCLKIKIYEYIIYQLNKRDLREIIGISC